MLKFRAQFKIKKNCSRVEQSRFRAFVPCTGVNEKRKKEDAELRHRPILTLLDTARNYPLFPSADSQMGGTTQ